MQILSASLLVWARVGVSIFILEILISTVGIILVAKQRTKFPFTGRALYAIYLSSSGAILHGILGFISMVPLFTATEESLNENGTIDTGIGCFSWSLRYPMVIGLIAPPQIVRLVRAGVLYRIALLRLTVQAQDREERRDKSSGDSMTSKQMKELKWWAKHRFIIEKNFVTIASLIYIFVIIFVYSMLAVSRPEFFTENDLAQCLAVVRLFTPVDLALTAMTIVVALIIIVLTIKMRDGYYIRMDLVWVCSLWFAIGPIMFILTWTLSSLRGVIIRSVLEGIGIISSCLGMCFFPFIISWRTREKQLPGSSSVPQALPTTIIEMLEHDDTTVLDKFLEFLKINYAVENITFVQSVLHFKENPNTNMQADIINNFIKVRSVQEINIDSEVRREILEKNMESEVDPMLFDEALDTTITLLEKDLLQRFRRTKEWRQLEQKYASEGRRSNSNASVESGGKSRESGRKSGELASMRSPDGTFSVKIENVFDSTGESQD